MILRAWDGYSLKLTLYPSFTLSLLKSVGNTYVKRLGLYRGLAFEDYLNGVKVRHSDYDLNYVKELCGIVEDPLNLISHVDPKFNDVYYYLIMQWRGVGLSTASKDFDYIFIATFLSKRTSYHSNVLSWIDKIFSIVDNVDEILNINVSEMFKSPQTKELNTALRNYMYNVRPYVIRGDVDAVRNSLLEVRGVGPKIVYAYLLHAMRCTDIAPADTHLTYFTNKVLGLNVGQPIKKLCLKYECRNCKHNCIVGYLKEVFGSALGYMQTVVYVHVKTLCKKGKCDVCMLRTHNLCRI
ncbi:MAG: hypothetical protein QW339_01035 [Sulfolobales archaeon]